MRLVLLTGMSGAGKSIAGKHLEDMGFNLVDNLPIPLLKNFCNLTYFSEDEKVAVGIDIRSKDLLPELSEILSELKNEGKNIEVLYLDASDDVLLKRYKETRRNHPLSGTERILPGIEEERKRMEFLRERADYVIDTTHLLTKELREELKKIFTDNENYINMNVMIMSFGYKYGLPEDADLVFDVRFLPNPFYIQELRPLTGNDKEIRDFVTKDGDAAVFTEKTFDLVSFLIPRYIKEGKNNLVVAFGCTGGKHRSVTIANEMYEKLLSSIDGIGLKVMHRDIEKDKKIGK
ncbi:MAG: RNase adapter RapZ [Lachnospiraceae bacterium]|nr:RNase adapter RapZ [Lachnospiraceae bacterium]